MKTILFLSLLVFWTSGCATMPLVMNPKVSAAIEDAKVDLPITRIVSGEDWSRTYGHGLDVQIFAKRDSSEYRRDFDIELDGAAKICAALVRSDKVAKRDYISLRFTTEYGRVPPGKRNLAGVVWVIIPREKLRMLLDQNLPPSEYPKHWKLFKALKDQPDTTTLLAP